MTRTPNELTDLPDRAPGTAPVDLLTDVLAAVRLAGAVFLRAEYTSPWAYESPPAAALTSILRPGAKRLILFHIIAEGSCWITVNSGERLEVSEGDVVVLPYGEQHVMGSAELVPPVPIASLLPVPPWQQFPVIRYGGGENLYGYQEIAAFRAARSPAGLARTLSKTVITTYGRDVAVASTLFHRPSMRGKVGRQMQTWMRGPEGWRVVAAHVSVIDEPTA